MPAKDKQDLITNIIQDQLEQVAKVLKRDDFELAILLTPHKRPRYAFRMGGTAWLKDIDLPRTLETICASPDDIRKKAAELSLEVERHKSVLETIETMQLWTNVKPTFDPTPLY